MYAYFSDETIFPAPVIGYLGSLPNIHWPLRYELFNAFAFHIIPLHVNDTDSIQNGPYY